MTKEEVFEAWAPYGPPWSSWAKPVLFAHLELAQGSDFEATLPTLFPKPDAKVALVLELPGAEAVSIGVVLAKIGYRPVPLYNALPLPQPIESLKRAHGHDRLTAVVDTVPIISALRAGAEILASLKLDSDAPPVFLLDADRRGRGKWPNPGQFDNRSISFPTDFPSAEILSTHGIKSVLLVQPRFLKLQPDLEPTLRRWQDAHIPLERLFLEPGAKAEPLVLKPQSWFRYLISTILSVTNPRPNNGSFGTWTSAGG